MLRKLLKYEFKETARIIPLFYLIALIFAGMVLSAKTLGISWFEVTSSVLLMLMGIAVAFTTFILIVLRFYKNLYSNEGYLMFTLPVEPKLLLASKAIVAFCWMIISYIVCCFSMYLSLYGLGLTGELTVVWGVLESYGMEKFTYLIIPLIVLATLYFLAQIYFAITLSNSPLFYSMGPASAFLIFIVTNIILQIIEAIFTVFVPFSLRIDVLDKIGIELSSKNMFGFLLDSFNGVEISSFVLGLGGYLFQILMAGILFYVTTRSMKKKISIK